MPTQTSLSSVPVNVALPQNLDDTTLAAWLEQCRRAGCTVGYLHAQSLCKVFDTTSPSAQLHPVDPDKKSRAVLKKLAQQNLLQQLDLPLAILTAANAADTSWTLAPVAPDEITTLVDERLRALGRTGRGADISQLTAWKVWTDAGGCCMFEGCGANLSTIPLYNRAAKISYLAHIIASDPNGPRGTLVDSHRLSNDANNIMLMCDAHHRLIDSFALSDYPAARLYAMRQAHRDLVRSYMDSLAYPRVQAITIHADLAGIPTYFQESDLIGAILETGRAMLPGVVPHLRRTNRDDRRTPDFWEQYLHEHENQIQLMVSSFNTPGGAGMSELAIFPLHHSATLVLAGRIIGEARPVRVFQYHRHRCTWRWDRNATPQPSGTFTVEGLTSQQANEVLITIELTANLDVNALPVNLSVETSNGRMPWVRIRTLNPNSACIQHPNDLDQFTNIARGAINHVQDVMHVKRVHLIAISPASTVFCFGQMLQAGHHPTYTMYDRPGRETPFVEAFSISGHAVTAGAGAQTTNISLR